MRSKEKFILICEFCKSNFIVPYCFRSKKFCNKNCHSKSKIGQPSWNKGLKTGISSDKQKEVARERWLGENNPRFKKPPIKENHPAWIKDRTKLKDDSKDRGGQLHKEWSRSVKDRDNWKCRIADVNCDGRMESHHILGWSEYPELRYNINNGITLCHFHHPRKREDEKRLSPYFMELVSVSKE